MDPNATLEAINERWRYLQRQAKELQNQKQALKTKSRWLDQEAQHLAEKKEQDSKRNISFHSSASCQDETLEMKMRWTKEEVYNAQDTVTSIQIQPNQQLQVTNLRKEIDQGECQLKMMLFTIQILENGLRNNPDRKSQQTLEDMQDEALKQTRYVEELKAQLSKTQDTAKKFKLYMQMPMYEQKPRWHHEDCSVMDPRNITKVINDKFNPAQYPALEFKHIWTKVLRCGWEHYLNERDHLSVLGYVLSGEPLETYESCMRSKKDLHETLN